MSAIDDGACRHCGAVTLGWGDRRLICAVLGARIADLDRALTAGRLPRRPDTNLLMDELRRLRAKLDPGEG